MYFYKSRYYNPKIARFIQPDTVNPDPGNSQAYNKYAYVANNPLKYVDPSGHSFFGWFKKLIGAAIAIAVGVILAVTPGVNISAISIAVIAGASGGLVGGAVNGGFQGAFLGMIFGALMGLASAGAGQGASDYFKNIYGLTKTQAGWASTAVMGSVGASIAGATGGWKGLLVFGITFAAAIGAGLVGAAKGGRVAGEDYSDFDDAIGGDVGPGEPTTNDIIAADIAKSSVPRNGRGYMDINGTVGSGVGVTGGMIIDSKGYNYVYFGGGITNSPGFALTASPSSVALGWNFGFQTSAGPIPVGLQVGWSPAGGFFWEAGLVTPGFSLTGYYMVHVPNKYSGWQ